MSSNWSLKNKNTSLSVIKKQCIFSSLTMYLKYLSFITLLLFDYCSSVVKAFAHGAMDCRIDPSWGGPIELFLVPTSAPRLV